ncbi:MAG TPA: ABC transporter ATP-binding protein [Baekduia sp.]|uniref:ABC transporter ATP-binding protein n=1 Tax=Baekduia sp. TaxID=2600305 RepID=UPI002D7954B3|nr:ABC transporter ATP-binding protein [Baekduia sp.]HET6509866.1 ABC transporter ATP-binding protein [Baekduia sp.]
MTADAERPALAVRGLGIAYETHHYSETAVEDVSFDVGAGRIVAVVGESGSGKTTIARAAVGLLPATARVAEGSGIAIDGIEVVGAPEPVLQAMRGSVVGFVPQDPGRSLHPLKRIGAQIGEVLLEHRICAKGEVDERVEALLTRVGIDEPATRARQFPHEFSGGMLQRVLIAIAIAGRPALVVADEPTSALDVTVQAQVLALLEEIVEQDGVSVLLITHDLELAAAHADDVVVLHDGRLVEQGPTARFFEAPSTDYTRTLLAASPKLAPRPPRPGGDGPPILTVEDVRRDIRLGGWGRSRVFSAVDGVSFALGAGRTVALVGESGAGKTSLARLALGLERPTDGRVVFDGVDVARLDRAGRRALRRATHLVSQHPAASFDPRWSVEQVIAEPLRNAGHERSAITARVRELLDQVGLSATALRKGALELSGGQQQRVAIARAIGLRPRLVVCDEPTSALDVTVQARIIALLRELQDETGVSYLFISHDLAVVSELADEIVVLRRGRVVEAGRAHDVLTAPREAYTRALIAAVPGGQRPSAVNAPR